MYEVSQDNPKSLAAVHPKSGEICIELLGLAGQLESSSPGRTRTYNPAVNSRMLYH